ncbi:MAG TPA: quinone-dependent dihydroorotate dehydrogenase [Pelomicrobium sp.]|nr:quinone-dependent dihydroorotate dehydrogenase [Pelomicrobium sp.]
MLYALARPALFALDPETAHDLTLASLDWAHRLHADRVLFHPPAGAPVEVMGLAFPNAVGLAAGMDKNGAHVDALGALGFGFIEVGTVTPRPQPGNPKPRLFRFPQAEAVINRMGFNNDGVDALLANLEGVRYRGVLGINIGKNFDTPLERAADDYVACLKKVYARAAYVTVNVSSPNTVGLRTLQAAEALAALLERLQREARRLAERHGKATPLAVKLAPDLDDADLQATADVLRQSRVDAVIATNTTISRPGVAGLAHGDEAGGLSGAPLKALSTDIVRKLKRALRGEIPVIGVGGILCGADALEKLDAGASLVQVYTGLIFRGPDLVGELVRAVAKRASAARRA